MTVSRSAAVARLVDVLAAENAALKRLDHAAAAALLRDKEAALAALDAAPAERVAAAALQRLDTLAEENRTLLERSIAVQIRVVRLLVQAGAKRTGGAVYTGGKSRATPYRIAATA